VIPVEIAREDGVGQESVKSPHPGVGQESVKSPLLFEIFFEKPKKKPKKLEFRRKLAKLASAQEVANGRDCVFLFRWRGGLDHKV
jgi:hypothetical protein